MRLLLDTHVLLAWMEERLGDLPGTLGARIERSEESKWVSVVSLWEIAIKWRLGKLPIAVELEQLPETLKDLGFGLLPIEAHHVLADIGPEPAHKDPFDRALIAQAIGYEATMLTSDETIQRYPGLRLL